MNKLLVNALAWTSDYSYILRAQIRGFAYKKSSNNYIQRTPSPTILLLPGVYEPWYIMRPIAELLYNKGYSVHVVETLGYNVGSIEAMAEVTQQYIIDNNLQNFVIVAHSKGGLIAKLLLHMDTVSTIKGAITISTPYDGSPYAYFLPFKNLRIFIPRSKVLGRLRQYSDINEKIVSIYGRFDPHIPRGSFLSGADNVKLDVAGHFRILEDSSAHRAILDTLIKWCH